MTKKAQSDHSRFFFWGAVATVILAIATHSYLLIQHFELKFGATSGKSLCDVNELFNCSAVAASKYAEFLGVPMAMWGWVANFALLILVFWFPLTEDEKKPTARRGLVLVSGGIAAASIVMGLISMIGLSKVCLFCATAYILSFITFGLIWKFPGAESKRAKTLVTKTSPLNGLTPVLIVSVVAFIAAFIGSDQVGQHYGGSADLDRMAKEQVAEWQVSPQQAIQTSDPLVMGASKESAKMTIVEFADFRCIHCKHAAPVMKAFVSAHPDARLEFEAWPLDGECNTAITSANGASCLLARSVWCAEKNGGHGWLAHEYIFDQDIYMDQQAVETALPQIAAAAKLSPDVMKTCTASNEAKEAVRKTAAIGTALNIQGTPTIYVNGRKLGAGQALSVLREAYQQITR